MKEDFLEFLQATRNNIPKNAADLRSASDSIISGWISLDLGYPHNLSDNFVYIESSIERIMYENFNDSKTLAIKCKESYDFHIDSFIRSVLELQSFLKKA